MRFAWRLTQTPYRYDYGPTTSHSGDAALGMQSDLLYYDLH
jgi:hypothetical protein